MKKILLSVVITACVMTGIGYLVINNVCQNYEEELTYMSEENEYLTNEYNNSIGEYESELTELSEQVYNMKTDKPYSIEIYHDGEYHVWESEDNEGLFKDEIHFVSY